MKIYERMKWAFAGFFVLCLLVYFFTGEKSDAMRDLFAGLAIVSLGGFGLCKGWSSWEEGAIELRRWHYNRQEQPRRFMAAWLFVTVCAAITLLCGLWYLLLQ